VSPPRRRVAEERAAYGAVVVDASVAVQWFASEPESEDAASLLRSGRDLLAPDVMPVEAANTWWAKWRRKDLTSHEVEQAIANLLALQIPLIPSSLLLPQAARLATELDHPIYDCVYLALSVDRGAALATGDTRLRRAAQARSIPRWRP
jgi:predicted nucleic acid-binding protein